MDSPLQPVVLDQAQHEIVNQYLDAAKARHVLNWQPLFTLQGGLRRTIDWYRHYCGDRKLA